MAGDTTDRTFYLEAAGQPVHAVFHQTTVEPRGTAVILCPPFGFDEVCSYRPRREWARRLAASGHPALRLSYPGTGDSGGTPHDTDLFDGWCEAVANAAAWLEHQAGVSRVTAVGLGIGGVVAYLAAARGAPIVDLVLWGAPARGRMLIRQLRAFSALELDQCYEGLEPPSPLPEGQLQAGGFLLGAQFTEALEQLNLVNVPLPDATSRRALLLERDGIAVDRTLQGHLESQGVTVKVAPGDGYASMTSHPQRSFAPNSVIDEVTTWLDAGDTASHAPDHDTGSGAGESPTATLHLETGSVHETPMTFDQPFGRLSGVLTEPLGPAVPGMCWVLLSAGAVRCSGPNRMWAELARRWASRGIRVFRLDVEGIGDADGEVTPYAEDGALYVEKLTDQVIAALDELQARGLGERFVLMGLCGGAYWSFHVILRDDRVTSGLLLNPRAIVWDEGLLPARDVRAFLSQPMSLAKIRQEASVARLVALVRWLLAAPQRWLRKRRAPASGIQSETDRLLDRLRASGKSTLVLFTEHEPLRDELARSGALARVERWPNVRLEYVAVRDHTIRPVQAQRLVNALLDRVLEREFVSGSAPVAATHGSPATE